MSIVLVKFFSVVRQLFKFSIKYHLQNFSNYGTIYKINKEVSDLSLHESAEMYLETIYVLSEKLGSVRSVDVAEHMGYSKPSVSRAVGILKRDGLLLKEKDGALTLTEAGRDTAQKIFKRHTLLTEFLKKIGVSHETASDDACKIEHVISDETINAMKNFIEK